MSKFKVYYSIFGKKLATKIEATSPYHAQQIVKEKILFHKTELIEEDNIMEDKDIKDFFGGIFK